MNWTLKFLIIYFWKKYLTTIASISTTTKYFSHQKGTKNNPKKNVNMWTANIAWNTIPSAWNQTLRNKWENPRPRTYVVCNGSSLIATTTQHEEQTDMPSQWLGWVYTRSAGRLELIRVVIDIVAKENRPKLILWLLHLFTRYQLVIITCYRRILALFWFQIEKTFSTRFTFLKQKSCKNLPFETFFNKITGARKHDFFEIMNSKQTSVLRESVITIWCQ